MLRLLHLSVFVLAAIAISSGISACDESGTGAARQPPPAQPPTLPPVPTGQDLYTDWQGYYVGALNSGFDTHYAEALLTEDGHLRILILSPSPSQFVGRVDFGTEEARASGILVRESCALDAPADGCDTAVDAAVTISQAYGWVLSFTITAHDVSGDRSWSGSLAWPTATFTLPATLDLVAGQYVETLADFAHGGDVVIDVDDNGAFFFQSEHSGCTGNGVLSAHAGGQDNVYDAYLLIENCDETHAYLNRRLEGLATRSVGDADWGDWLVLWLSAADDSHDPAAVTMWAWRL